MYRKMFLSLFLVCGLLKVNSSLGSETEITTRRWITPDFYIEIGRPETSLLAIDNQTCRERISEIMCLVDPQTEEERENERPCLKGGKEYAKYFEALYDHYPVAFQKMFCSLKVIYIENQLGATAYAGVIRDENGKAIGAKMGVRKSLLDDGLGLATWASWKEQLSFGGVKDSQRLLEDLPLIVTSATSEVNDFLYFVIAHEFGHIFDFSNEINTFKSEDCAQRREKDPSVECEMHEDSFGALSWKTDRSLKPEYEFPHRRGLCFYWCNDNPLDRSFIPQIYSDLDKGNLISLYGSLQPYDDFAESMAYYLMSHHLVATYLIDTRQGQIYNIMEKVLSDRFRSKSEFIGAFLGRPDIIYP